MLCKALWTVRGRRRTSSPLALMFSTLMVIMMRDMPIMRWCASVIMTMRFPKILWPVCAADNVHWQMAVKALKGLSLAETLDKLGHKHV